MQKKHAKTKLPLSGEASRKLTKKNQMALKKRGGKNKQEGRNKATSLCKERDGKDILVELVTENDRRGLTRHRKQKTKKKGIRCFCTA